MHLKLHL